jgi:hypothetical protein
MPAIVQVVVFDNDHDYSNCIIMLLLTMKLLL